MTKLTIYKLGTNERPAGQADIDYATRYLDSKKRFPKDIAYEKTVVSIPKSKSGSLVVFIGDRDRPASKEDISDLQKKLSKIDLSKNCYIVTHHSFDAKWINYQSVCSVNKSW